MTDRTKSHIRIVLDRSGSMSVCKQATEEGFRAFIDEQRKVSGECLVTLAQFDTEYEVLYANRPVHQVPDLYLSPRGGTALLDAIGRSIDETGQYLSSLPEDQRPGAVIFVILTDGQENSSQKFDLRTVHDMISHQRDRYQWQFVFLGANQDAIASGTAMGMARGQTMTYDVANTQHAMTSAASNVAHYRSSVSSGTSVQDAVSALDFNDTQREEAVKQAKAKVKK